MDLSLVAAFSPQSARVCLASVRVMPTSVGTSTLAGADAGSGLGSSLGSSVGGGVGLVPHWRIGS